MSIRESMALKTILKIIGTWEKMSKKLEAAMDVLKESVSANKAKQSEIKETTKQKIKTLEERERLKTKELDIKNEELLKSLQEAEAFKKNIEKMFKQD